MGGQLRALLLLLLLLRPVALVSENDDDDYIVDGEEEDDCVDNGEGYLVGLTEEDIASHSIEIIPGSKEGIVWCIVDGNYIEVLNSKSVDGNTYWRLGQGAHAGSTYTRTVKHGVCSN